MYGNAPFGTRGMSEGRRIAFSTIEVAKALDHPIGRTGGSSMNVVLAEIASYFSRTDMHTMRRVRCLAYLPEPISRGVRTLQSWSHFPSSFSSSSSSWSSTPVSPARPRSRSSTCQARFGCVPCPRRPVLAIQLGWIRRTLQTRELDACRENKEEAREALDGQPKMENTFTWQHFNYEVVGRRLLNGVSGYVAPGKLMALRKVRARWTSSGRGSRCGSFQTALLNVLAESHHSGRQVSTGYMDVFPPSL